MGPNRKEKMIRRITIDALLIIAAFIMPWWLVVIASVYFLFKFERFYEIILMGLVLDSLYSVPVKTYGDFELIFTVSAFSLYIVAIFARNKLKFYS
jgi:hypothetical protein